MLPLSQIQFQVIVELFQDPPDFVRLVSDGERKPIYVEI
jgi:hypothetical protein